MKHHQARTNILVYRLTNDLVLSLEMIDTVLFMGKPSSTFGTHEGILFTTLILQVTIQVIVPVVRTLTVGTDKNSLGPSVGVFGLSLPFPSFLGRLVGICFTFSFIMTLTILLFVQVLVVILTLRG